MFNRYANIIEQRHEKYDVIVIGGGVSGVSAAVAARRQGLRTLLIEKGVMLGGLATLGNIAFYLPLCDGNGHQVAGGLAEELLYESIRYGYGDLDDSWNIKLEKRPEEHCKRYKTIFSPPGFVIALDELIVREGIDLIFDAVFSEPVMEDKRCKGVIIETKMGRHYYEASAFVDATGDGDLIIRAGADYYFEKNWLSCWAYSISLDSAKEAVNKQDVKYAIKLETQGEMHSGVNPKDRVYMLNDITKFILESRKMLNRDILSDNKKKAYVNLSGIPQFRTTCRLVGFYNLTELDFNKRFDDSIGAIGDWRKPRNVCEIPFRSLISPKLDNIFAAGRCISSAGEAWELTRVIPACAITGQAAGISASELVKSRKTICQLNVSNIQKTIEQANGIIHF